MVRAAVGGHRLCIEGRWPEDGVAELRLHREALRGRGGGWDEGKGRWLGGEEEVEVVVEEVAVGGRVVVVEAVVCG